MFGYSESRSAKPFLAQSLVIGKVCTLQGVLIGKTYLGSGLAEK
jgi:hypothetical protein